MDSEVVDLHCLLDRVTEGIALHGAMSCLLSLVGSEGAFLCEASFHMYKIVTRHFWVWRM